MTGHSRRARRAVGRLSWCGTLLLWIWSCQKAIRETPTDSVPLVTLGTRSSERPAPRASAPNAGGVSAGEVDVDVSPADAPLAYRRITLGETRPQHPLPWVLALHGLGDSPAGFAHLFEGVHVRAHVYLAQAPLAFADGYDWLGVRVQGNPAELALRVQERLPQLAALLDSLAAHTDNEGDAVVTGFSQGGILSYAVAVAGLPHVKAALPIAGWLPPSLASVPPTVPVFAFHGENDTVVPFPSTERMIGTWKSGATTLVDWHTYPGLAHRIDAKLKADWALALERSLR